MRPPIFTLTTAAISAVSLAIAVLLDYYHYGSESLRKRLQRWLAATRRIDWRSLAEKTASLSLKADAMIFGRRLISFRSLSMSILLIIAATAVPTYAESRKNPGNLTGEIVLAVVFGCVSVPLGVVALHFGRLVLRRIAPRASVLSSVALTFVSLLTAQAVLLVWVAIFSIVLLAFFTVCYNHAIYMTDSAPIAVLFSVLAQVYSRSLLPAALFPLALYFALGLALVALHVSNTGWRILTNFLKSQIETEKPKVFTDGAKLLGAFAMIVAFSCEMLQQTSLFTHLDRYETALQDKTIFAGIHAAAPICDRFVDRPKEFRLYLFTLSFFYEAFGHLFEQKKLTREMLNEAWKSLAQRWEQHLPPPPLPVPQSSPTPSPEAKKDKPNQF